MLSRWKSKDKSEKSSGKSTGSSGKKKRKGRENGKFYNKFNICNAVKYNFTSLPPARSLLPAKCQLYSYNAFLIYFNNYVVVRNIFVYSLFCCIDHVDVHSICQFNTCFKGPAPK